METFEPKQRLSQDDQVAQDTENNGRDSKFTTHSKISANKQGEQGGDELNDDYE